MSFEQQLNTIYQKIGQKVNDIIPVDWEEFYFNGEVENGEGGVFFFFKEKDKANEYIYSHDIPDSYSFVEEREYHQEIHELFKLVNDLQEVFIKNNQEKWFSINMIVNAQGQLKIDFCCNNWNLSDFGPSSRIDYFKYKYLNKKPTNNEEKKLMEQMKNFEKTTSYFDSEGGIC
ncbi:immunity protein YezG family protein [Priestia aryabhattai]|uniref:immunity protein YezG family protein n=1 Tax=Priestia aryabhattai TaxID=412384 RepID=UPI002041DEC0|nr:immunity protein YezG family protein [Priestia aryabhattai]MCM3255504.1 antitoxin YezG family protein [Priestia aryabhattai]